ncbi:hypothetical protein N5K21_22440 [Rhizobium pusense]|uniref:Uncharacterized protein n=1 Tax=Agrobacterium pusense TaxID=648995 RepID=A0A6H0ZQY5_9HYPH|nr:hypothetical protein [Agrobacterium pusense]MDH2091494.1 hypothetical protein [Agrobacterium pusense]QIX22633.1 hypothetical protein FOB41_16535 [Agrobacterium pusense]WCK24545.1 hypothetical protein CFBP5496_0002835 [Agrobacterium pusense]
MAKDDVFQVDTRGFDKSLSRIEKQVLPQAQAGLLNGLAFGARKSLLAYADKTIQGKPTAWTRKGFVVDKATPESLEAVVRIQPQQAGYMTYLINGGVRKTGDVGATPFDVLTDAPDDQKNAFGNLKRGYLKRIARQAKAEKTKRARLAAKRDKLRAAGKPTTPARWAANNVSGKPGIFFGKIGNQKGYWQRAAKRDGDYKIKLLARMSDEAVYKPTFRWDETISASVRSADTAKLYSGELTRALRKLNGG